MKVRLLDVFAQLEAANPELRFNRSDGSPQDATQYAGFYWHHVLPVQGLKLGLPRANSLAVPEHCTDLEFLREMDSLKYINTQPFHESPAQFWLEYEARQNIR